MRHIGNKVIEPAGQAHTDQWAKPSTTAIANSSRTATVNGHDSAQNSSIVGFSW